jgi:membrane-bound lytic murein transglycosylase MltF
LKRVCKSNKEELKKPVIVLLILFLVLVYCSFLQAQAPVPPDVSQMKIFQTWTGDLDGMVKRRVIRTLVAYNKTTYFLDNGIPRGIGYDAMKEFETELNKKLKLGTLGVVVVFIPTSRDQLLSALANGRGDIAIGAITVTSDRQKLVDFTDPIYKNVSEIVVTGPGAPQITAVQDLSGKEIFVRKSSSEYQSLLALNEQLKKEGKKEVVIRLAADHLEDEDLLQMANAGLIKMIVVDQFLAEFWKQILNKITLHPNVVVRTGGDIAWAIRKNTPQLKTELNTFLKTHVKGTEFGNVLFQEYLKDIKIVENATSESELQKYSQLKSFFKKYGEQYSVDWVLMTAQGYQESRLNQNVKSNVGAIGVMQLMPSTGKQMGIADIYQAESNIHAGVKYMQFMRDQYYKNEPMDDLNKTLFTFASYNAGPEKIQELREEAKKRGLNPNVWFNNVEYIVSEKIGQQTVTYVSNIYKYYIAYKLVEEQNLAREKAEQQIEQN